MKLNRANVESIFLMLSGLFTLSVVISGIETGIEKVIDPDIDVKETMSENLNEHINMMVKIGLEEFAEQGLEDAISGHSSNSDYVPTLSDIVSYPYNDDVTSVLEDEELNAFLSSK